MLAMNTRAIGSRRGDGVAFDLVHLRVFEYLTALAAAKKAEKRNQIFPRVELRLVVVTHARVVDKRHRVNVRGVEPKLRRQVGFSLQIDGVAFLIGPAGRGRRVEEVS